MQYQDEIYGTTEITEPVLLALLESEAVQRLKGISQHGVTADLGITPPFSRFEHSVGVMLLVRRLGASLEEQVAALLHDVSHTAFSHIIDFVLVEHAGQSYHEMKQEEFLASSDIPAILRRYELNWRELLDETRFPLLERPAPELCADRLDYFFRDLEFLRLGNLREIRHAIDSLAVKGSTIAVKCPDVARWLACSFIEADRASWSSFREVGLYQVTAEAIKRALHHGYVEEADFWGSDEALWAKLSSADHPEIRRWIRLIGSGTRFTWEEHRPAFRVSPKVRSIDPPVIVQESAVPLSTLDPDFKRLREAYLASKQGSWPMGIVSIVEPQTN